MQTNTIEDIISKYYVQKNEPKEHKDRFFPAHSSAFIDMKKYKKLQGKCLRAAYYSCLGMKEQSKIKLNQSLTLSLGDYTEKMLLDIFSRSGILIDKGVKFEIEKYKIAGKVDAIIKLDDEEIGVEIKSIGSNKWTVNSIFGSPWNKPEPKWEHLFQTLIYCYALRDRLSYFFLYYIRRDTGERQSFKIAIEPIDSKMYCSINGIVDYRFTVDDILERYELLDNFILKEQVPPREYLKVYDKAKIKDYVDIGFLSKKQSEKYSETAFGDFNCLGCSYSLQCDKDK